MAGTGGELLVSALAEQGVEILFTLNGGHLFPVYAACQERGVRVIDTRHEQTAVFAAEGLAKLSRRPQVAAVTAGPGVTNSVSAISTAFFNGSPLLVLGGRAPQARWGSGSLQEIDHLPLVRSITKHAATLFDCAAIPREIGSALALAAAPHRGPVFLDVPIDVLFTFADPSRPEAAPAPPTATSAQSPAQLEPLARLLATAEKPVVIAGSDVYWNGAGEALEQLALAAQLPLFFSGMARGLLPADHPQVFSRARSLALKAADLVLVIGTPLDFRLGFGKFGPQCQVAHLADCDEGLARHLPPTAAVAGPLDLLLQELAAAQTDLASVRPAREAWQRRLRDEETARRRADLGLLQSSAAPIHPARIYGELKQRLTPDAVVVGDGGDFVSFAGRFIDSSQPGCWMDPGPFGCLGTGLGYAIAARLAHPQRQVVLLLGDGALGFSAMDFDTLVRFGLPVVAICGNNGVWGLEKQPMQALYGFSVATDLQPGCRYDQLVQALGGHGELVSSPEEIGPALDRAFAAGKPALVNILTDPEIGYPRSAILV